jgi:hypothetical protein
VKRYLDPPPDATEWLDAARDRRLLVQRCTECDHRQLYPRPVCVTCGSFALEWLEASGRGTVHTYTVIHQNRVPGWADELPYVVAMIDLEEGARMMSNVVECASSDVRVGMPVEVTFVADETMTLPKFRPAG